MRIATFTVDRASRLGVVRGDRIFDLEVIDASIPMNLPALLARDANLQILRNCLAELDDRNGIPLSDVKLTCPIAKESKIICVGLNYREHSKEAKLQQPDYPVLFTRYLSSFVGHDQPLAKPSTSSQLDWEGELVAIIGRSGRNIPKERALEHVAAYTIANEGSVRDWQLRTSQWTVGKNFDASGSIGPDIITADELPVGGKGLSIETRVNGVTMQSASTSDMIFDLPTVIEYLTKAMTLEPGDAILTGTPSGVGFARKPQIFLNAGDVCEVEIERIGILRNSVVDAQIAEFA